MAKPVVTSQPAIFKQQKTPPLVVQKPPVGVAVVTGRGPQGPPGTASSFVFTQALPSTSWTVTHNLGRNPVVQVLDTLGNVIRVSVRHTSTMQFVVSPDVPIAGTAVYG